MDGENAEFTEQSIMLACKGQSCSTNAWILGLTAHSNDLDHVESKSEAWFMTFQVLAFSLKKRKSPV